MIDWQEVARLVGAGETGSTAFAQAALATLLGEDEIHRAVDWYVEERPSRELVRCVLALLRSYDAMRRCHEIYSRDPDRTRRVNAIELLRFIADRRAVGWVATYLADPDEAIQSWGAGLVVHLVRLDCEGPEMEAALETLRASSKPAFQAWLENLEPAP